MFPGPLRLLRRALCLAAVLCPVARANFWIVGPGAGADFPDIPAAIAGSQPGDVLLVRSASYSGGFTLDKGLTIIGYGSVQLSGPGVVAQIPAGQRATIVHLSLAALSVEDCDGPVLLQELTSHGPVDVSLCADARFLALTTDLPRSPHASAVTISNSRVEIVSSDLEGSSFDNPFDWGSLDGGPGLTCEPGARVHLAGSNARGGHGQGNLEPNPMGDGGPAIYIPSTAEMMVAGPGELRAGFGGEASDFHGDWQCCLDGHSANVVLNGHGMLWYSGIGFYPAWDYHSCGSCIQLPVDTFGGVGTNTNVTPDDPALFVAGSATPGSTVTLTLAGPAGASAVLHLGRGLALASDPGIRIERLVEANRTVDLGVIPAGGEVHYSIGVPSLVPTGRFMGWFPGTMIAAQGEITLSGGRVRRTNSVPIVVR